MVHMSCCRRMSRQWASECQPYSAQKLRYEIRTHVPSDDKIVVLESPLTELVVVIVVVVERLAQ